MGRLIDANKLIDKFKYIEQRECTAIFVNKIIEIIEDQPTEETIPKDQYEQRLKADMVAMLTDIQLEIEEMDSGCGWEGYRKTDAVIGLIQQKINKLQLNAT